jgi:predicted Rossmann fold flavoprotein
MIIEEKADIAVIGGGPAGMMAAGTAISYGSTVCIFEHMPYLGKKLGITGKGRCNVTNASNINDFLDNVTKNPRFLYSALNSFSPEDTMSFFEGMGVELKVERGNRVFPVSDKAKDIVVALRAYSSGATVIHEKVVNVTQENDVFTVCTAKNNYNFKKVIIATGGKSYPLTGSDGSGYSLAKKLGHKVTKLSPSLIPITSPDKLCRELQGLSLKNVAIKIINKENDVLYSDFGEMMFTHFGVTGPIILSASARLKDKDINGLKLLIDLKPALDNLSLDKRILKDFSENANKDFVNSLSQLLPSKLISPFVNYVKIEPRKKVNLITKEERTHIVHALKNFTVNLNGFRPIEEAIITSGGIEVNEINPRNMESKLVNSLYFAGEVIDVDAYTGGFNLQIAYSTGYLAGKSAAESLY